MDRFDAQEFEQMLADYELACELAKERLAKNRRKRDFLRARRNLAARLGEDPKGHILRLASGLPRELIAKTLSYESEAMDEPAWFAFCK